MENMDRAVKAAQTFVLVGAIGLFFAGATLGLIVGALVL